MSAKHAKSNSKKQDQTSKSVQVPRQHWSQGSASITQADGYPYGTNDFLDYQMSAGPFHIIDSVGAGRHHTADFDYPDHGAASVSPAQGSVGDMGYDSDAWGMNDDVGHLTLSDEEDTGAKNSKKGKNSKKAKKAKGEASSKDKKGAKSKTGK
ncbi:hypothetical protein MN608_06982 [Microdochium nivale]|nr:hypothetical protein MN608_06982 [Microdochium nivale]